MSMADVTNAEIMGGMYGPNPYSQFPGRVPQPGYVGTPTDAQGRPIAATPGMTLNSTPAQPQSAPQGQNAAQALYAAMSGPSAMNPSGNAAFGMSNWGFGIGPLGMSEYESPGMGTGLIGGGSSQPGAGSSSAAAPSGQLDNALSLLANPGHVTTPGANIPQSSPTANQPDVMSQFLASQGGGQGAGGYSNKGFFDTLNALKSGGTPAAQQQSSSLAPSPGAALTNAMAPVTPPGGGGAPYIGSSGAAAPGTTPTDFTPNQFSPATMALLQKGGVSAPSAAAPQPTSVGGLGGLGGAPMVNMGAMGGFDNGTIMGTATSNPRFMNDWHGMGSGNAGAAGNGSVGGQ